MRPLVLVLAILVPVAAWAQASETELMAQAQKAYVAGDEETAKAAFSEVLQINPRNTLAIQYLRNINLRHGGEAKPKDQTGRLVLEKVDFKDATFSAALEALKDQAARQSVNVSFVSQLTPEQMAHPVTISLSNIPFMDALRYVCSLNGAAYKVDKYAIIIVPAGGGGSPIAK